jgi:hypothetical protein
MLKYLRLKKKKYVDLLASLHEDRSSPDWSLRSQFTMLYLWSNDESRGAFYMVAGLFATTVNIIIIQFFISFFVAFRNGGGKNIW